MDSDTEPQSADIAPSDPKKLIFITPGVTAAQQDNREDSESDALKIFPNATIKYAPEHGAEGNILSQIEEQVRKHGTMHEIVIHAHGSPNQQYASYKTDAPDTLIGSHNVLEALKNLQNKLGVKIADRIVFDGCNTMSDLAPAWIDYYRDTAKGLQAEIVGATRVEWGAGISTFARFSPDGSISRDPISTSSITLDKFSIINVARSLAGTEKYSVAGIHHSDAWFKSYEGKSPAEGQADFENKINKDIHGHEFLRPAVSDIPDSLRLSSLGVKGWQTVVDRLGASLTQAGQEQARALSPTYYAASTANPLWEQKAVEAHEEFIRHLSPEDRQLLEHEAEKYKTDLVTPKPRDNSRDLVSIKVLPDENPGGQVDQKESSGVKAPPSRLTATAPS